MRMTKDQTTISRLVRDLDLERHRRVQAERTARALRMTLARVMAERRMAKQQREPDQPRLAC
jgi:hypothetical protein